MSQPLAVYEEEAGQTQTMGSVTSQAIDLCDVAVFCHGYHKRFASHGIVSSQNPHFHCNMGSTGDQMALR